jgi:hypothetical protein
MISLLCQQTNITTLYKSWFHFLGREPPNAFKHTGSVFYELRELQRCIVPVRTCTCTVDRSKTTECFRYDMSIFHPSAHVSGDSRQQAHSTLAGLHWRSSVQNITQAKSWLRRHVAVSSSSYIHQRKLKTCSCQSTTRLRLCGCTGIVAINASTAKQPNSQTAKQPTANSQQPTERSHTLQL